MIPKGALDGLRILDLSRILAGPTCTQLLGDLGAEVIKIENPKTGGDDTRGWGPPFVAGAQGEETDLSAYFMCANRNKLSVAVDIATEAGQHTVQALAAQAVPDKAGLVAHREFQTGGAEKIRARPCGDADSPSGADLLLDLGLWADRTEP
jgi:hypothetical protein